MTNPHLQLFAELVLDLDRCMHGRHAADPCFGCPGGNHGNPLIPPGTLIGSGLSGAERIVVPPNDQRYDPRAWRVPDTDQWQHMARSAAHSQSLMRLGAAALAYHYQVGNDETRDALNRAIDEHLHAFPGHP